MFMRSKIVEESFRGPNQAVERTAGRTGRRVVVEKLDVGIHSRLSLTLAFGGLRREYPNQANQMAAMPLYAAMRLPLYAHPATPIASSADTTTNRADTEPGGRADGRLGFS